VTRVRTYAELLGDSEACLRQVDRAIAHVDLEEGAMPSPTRNAGPSRVHAHAPPRADADTIRRHRGVVHFSVRDDLLRLTNQRHRDDVAARQLAYASSTMLDVETQLAQLTSMLGQDAGACENSPADSP
jgi:hypothetical protein